MEWRWTTTNIEFFLEALDDSLAMGQTDRKEYSMNNLREKVPQVLLKQEAVAYIPKLMRKHGWKEQDIKVVMAVLHNHKTVR